MAKRQPPLTIDDNAFRRALDKVGQEARTTAGKKAIDRTGKAVMRASMKNTPVEFGDVRDSHSFESRIDGDVVIGTINVSDPGAFFVQYDLEAKHDDGRPLFLTAAMRSRRGFFQKTIREELSDVIRANGLAE